MHCNVSGFEPLMAKSSINYEGAQGPHVMYKPTPGKNCSTKVWYATWLKKFWNKKAIQRERRKLQQKKMYKSQLKKDWKRLTWDLIHRN